MTNNDFIALLAKSIRDPKYRDYGAVTLETAAFVAKTQLVDLVSPEDLQSLLTVSQISIAALQGTVYGTGSLTGLTYGGSGATVTFMKDVALESKAGNSGRILPIRRVNVKDLDSFQYKYSGATSDSPVYTVAENKIYTMGLTAFTGLLWFIREPALLTGYGTTDIDIPHKFLQAWIDLSQSILYRWEGQFELSLSLYNTQYQILTGKKVMVEGENNDLARRS